jgi:hypothetical protein
MPNEDDYLAEMSEGGQAPPDGNCNGLKDVNEQTGKSTPTKDS